MKSMSGWPIKIHELGVQSINDWVSLILNTRKNLKIPREENKISTLWGCFVRLVSTSIRCTKCQNFGIWHTKHQKTSHIRCSKC